MWKENKVEEGGKKWRGLYLHSSLRPERRRRRTGVFLELNWQRKCEMFMIFWVTASCLEPLLRGVGGSSGQLEPPHAPPQLLHTLFFSEIGRRGVRDASQMLGSYINNRKRAIDLSFAELATILFPFLFCLSSLANGILILFDKRFHSMRFPLHEPRLMFRCFVGAGIHVALARTTKTSHSTFVSCWTFVFHRHVF